MGSDRRTRQPERGNRAGPIEKAEVKKRGKILRPLFTESEAREEEEEQRGRVVP